MIACMIKVTVCCFFLPETLFCRGQTRVVRARNAKGGGWAQTDRGNRCNKVQKGLNGKRTRYATFFVGGRHRLVPLHHSSSSLTLISSRLIRFSSRSSS